MATSSLSSSVNSRNLLVIGAGIHGLAAAKVLAEDASFDSITIYDKADDIGGVWNKHQIYDGLTTNSPLFTFEFPDWKYPEHMRKTGVHIPAQDVHNYLHEYAEKFGLLSLVKFQTEVKKIDWDEKSQSWKVDGVNPSGPFQSSFTHLVVCTGMYHTPEPVLQPAEVEKFKGKVFHSSEMGNADVRKAIVKSKKVVVLGAGKSAIDIATLIANNQWGEKEDQAPKVTLLYRRPHWLSPRKIISGLFYFELILFCRFVLSWQPFAIAPDFFHYFIANTWFGRWTTDIIFKYLSWDFTSTLGQGAAPDTIPEHPLAGALSGGLHVEPVGYLDSVRSGAIDIVKGTIQNLNGKEAQVKLESGGSTTLKDVDVVLLATGYRVSFPFFSASLLKSLGMITKDSEDTANISSIRLYRLMAPPATVQQTIPSQPSRNIAFSGFAYNLLNPAVAHVAGHWIADYFNGQLALPPVNKVKAITEHFHSWQAKTFGVYGAKGTHLGPHAPLFMDTLLEDMRLDTSHVKGSALSPSRFLREWFRPMFPEVYAEVGADRRARNAAPVQVHSKSSWSDAGDLEGHQLRQFALVVFALLAVFVAGFAGLLGNFR
nr:flavin-binding monooxygenase [Mycoleptodicus sp. DH-2022a]